MFCTFPGTVFGEKLTQNTSRKTCQNISFLLFILSIINAKFWERLIKNRNHYKLSIIDHQIITSIYISDYFSISGLALKDFCFPLVAEIPYSMTILMPKTTDRPTIQKGNMVQASKLSECIPVHVEDIVPTDSVTLLFEQTEIVHGSSELSECIPQHVEDIVPTDSATLLFVQTERVNDSSELSECIPQHVEDIVPTDSGTNRDRSE